MDLEKAKKIYRLYSNYSNLQDKLDSLNRFYGPSDYLKIPLFHGFQTVDLNVEESQSIINRIIKQTQIDINRYLSEIEDIT